MNSATQSPNFWNSPIVKSAFDVILTKTPLAPVKSISSSSGLQMADLAASSALFSPRPEPDPIIAIPFSDITVRTSAKSTLILPLHVINSATPCTAPNNTSFAALNASSKLISLPSSLKSFSFGMVIKESTYCVNSSIPLSAISPRFRPSKENGRVTTATVRTFISLANCATTGAAPVPVPPPIPAVMNTMSVPRNISTIKSVSSNAACLPTLGSAPAPRPLVTLSPNCRTFFILPLSRACASVLAQINSTCSKFEDAIC